MGVRKPEARKRRTEKVSQLSADVLVEQVGKLKELFPEAVEEGKVDFDKLRSTLGEFVDDRPERYSFSWAGKRDCIKMLQAPSRATLLPCPEESIDWDTTSNVFIEGENLEALKLLYKAYYGRVKMIYIDPPYNTGKDFIYPDNYTDPLDTYLRLTGQKDSEGNVLTSNPETSGRYHSAWLSMMYPRLFVARQLLRDDGVIFVSMDDNEVYSLRAAMNEIFGEENFVAQLVWKARQYPDSRALTGVSSDHEYLVVYSRSSEILFFGVPRDESKFTNPDGDTRGAWMSRSILGLANKQQRPNLHYAIIDPATKREFLPPSNTGWRYSRERMFELIKDGRIMFPKDAGGRPRERKFRSEIERDRVPFPTIVDDVFTAHGTAEIRELFGFDAFDFPKPTELVRRLAEQVTTDDDIVVDLFAGSSTTAHAVMLQNQRESSARRFVLVQLPEPTVSDSPPMKAGLKTIADIGKERIRRVIAKMKKEQTGKLATDGPQDLGFRVYKLAESTMKPWKGTDEKDPEKYAKTMEMFLDPLVEGWKPEDVIAEVALKEDGFGLNCRVEQAQPQMNTDEHGLGEGRKGKKNAGKNGKGANVYRVTDTDKEQFLYICLDDKVRLDDVKPLNLTRDMLFVCRDVALDDETAANLALQCRLRTI